MYSVLNLRSFFHLLSFSNFICATGICLSESGIHLWQDGGIERATKVVALLHFRLSFAQLHVNNCNLCAGNNLMYFLAIY